VVVILLLLLVVVGVGEALLHAPTEGVQEVVDLLEDGAITEIVGSGEVGQCGHE
jgi:hypothetical protein